MLHEHNDVWRRNIQLVLLSVLRMSSFMHSNARLQQFIYRPFNCCLLPVFRNQTHAHKHTHHGLGVSIRIDSKIIDKIIIIIICVRLLFTLFTICSLYSNFYSFVLSGRNDFPSHKIVVGIFRRAFIVQCLFTFDSQIIFNWSNALECKKIISISSEFT